MNKKTNDNKIRVIKISKDAIFEFLYEEFINNQQNYLDVNPSEVANVFDINFEKGEFIFCAYKLTNDNGEVVELSKDIDFQSLMNNIKDTTESVYADNIYKEYTQTELINFSKSDI